MGPQGPQGIQGVPGSDGKMGPAGPMGPQGATGPMGPIGAQGQEGNQGNAGQNGQNGQPGPMGPQGPSGQSGVDGAMGPPGPQGPQGIAGPMGPQGIQGVPGKDCDQNSSACCCEVYANLFATKPQTISAYNLAGDTVLFDAQNAVSVGSSSSSILTAGLAPSVAAAASAAVISAGGSAAGAAAASASVMSSVGSTFLVAAQASKAAVIAGGDSVTVGDAAKTAVLAAAPISSPDFDLSQVNVTGDIKFLKHGVYHLAWQLQARITPPVPNPVPSWSFGFWVNGVLVPGSIYSGYTQAPGDDACHSTGDVIIEVKANDLLRLRNTSISSVNLNPLITGSVFPITIASVNIECVKSLP